MSKKAQELLKAKAAATEPLDALEALVKALRDPGAVDVWEGEVAFSSDLVVALELADEVVWQRRQK